MSGSKTGLSRAFSQVEVRHGNSKPYLAGFLTRKNIGSLRATGQEGKALTNLYMLNIGDKPLPPEVSLAQWRQRFPDATELKISGRTLVPEDFPYLAGIKVLDISGCKGITDAAFVHLRGIHTLDMTDCEQITDAAFEHLRGIHTLDMSYCRQVTDAAFSHLRGIHTLFMRGCNQNTITDAAFAHLRGIHQLNMTSCSQSTITDAAFAHLSGIHTLIMVYCWQLTDAAIAHLRGIHILYMIFCNLLTDAALPHLEGINVLDMSYCNHATVTGATLKDLGCNITTLTVRGCNKSTKDTAMELYGVTAENPTVSKWPAVCQKGGRRRRRMRKSRRSTMRKVRRSSTRKQRF